MTSSKSLKPGGPPKRRPSGGNARMKRSAATGPAGRSVQSVLQQLKAQARPANVKGMARYGISTTGALGVSMPFLRRLAREIGQDHVLALSLWDSGIHEARILAALVDDPAQVTSSQMERWVLDLDSWDVCDQLCSNLFDRTRMTVAKARAWSRRKETFVKRAGFVLMAALAVHDKKAPDRLFLSFLPLIHRSAGDERNFVKKAVNWALRQIGKRNKALYRAALAAAEEMAQRDSSVSRWVASDALREFRNPKTIQRITSKERP